MKKVLIALLGILPGVTMAQGGAYKVTGDLGNGNNSRLMMVRYTVSTGQKKDSAQAVDGKFTFKGVVNDERQKGQIVVFDGQRQSSIIFYLEPGNIELKYPKGSAYYTVGGTPLNKDLQLFNTMMNKMLDSVNASGKSVNQFSQEIQPMKFELTKKFIRQHPGSPIGLDLLNEYAIGNNAPEELHAAYNMLKPDLQSSEKGKELASRIKGMLSAEVGDMAPLFSIPDTEGKNVSLADYKGKYVLVDFWATWCAPCMAEMPNLKKANELYSNKNFTILGVSLDRPDSKDLWLKVIKRDGLTWTQVSDLKWWYSQAAFLYNVNSVPANFLIDPQGRIIAKNLSGEALQAKLAEVIR